MSDGQSTPKKAQSRLIGGLLRFRPSTAAATSSQSSDVERQEIKRLEDLLQETQDTVSKLNSKLLRSKEKSENLEKQVHDIRKENDRLELLTGITSVSAGTRELVDKVAKLEYLLEVTGVSAFISKMKAFNDVTFELAEFLAHHLQVKPADVFEDELKEARSDLRRLLGDALLDLLQSQGRKNPTKPLSTLVLIVSQTLLVNVASICRNERAAKPASDGLTKRLVLKRFTSMFKLASWSLASSEDRSAFEDILETVFKADRNIDMATAGILRNKEFFMSLCGSGKVFAPDDMEALDGHRRTLAASSLNEEEEVVCTVGLGLTSRIPDRKGISRARAVVPVQVMLKSTLLHAMGQELEGEVGAVSDDASEPDARLDGRS